MDKLDEQQQTSDSQQAVLASLTSMNRYQTVCTTHFGEAAFDEKGQERPVIPVFIWNENEENERMNNGGAVKVWLQRALEELDKSLAKHYESHLILLCTVRQNVELGIVVREVILR